MRIGVTFWAALLTCALGFGARAQAPSTLPPAVSTPGPASASPAAAPVTAAPAPQPDADAGHTLSAEDAAAWLDGFVPYALARGDVAGAVVVVVKDGQVLLQKGYGYADVGKKTPVDPATTMFRPGSTSKLYTWTAVMQLVEQGKLDLDRDVNDYLDFKIPPFEGKPISLRNIMTHTAGFEEVVKHLIETDPKKLLTLREALTDWIPPRVYAPGTTPAYSNYATALAGYIVQRVSGEKFDAYIDHHIFQPLAMTHATFTQPLPAQFNGDMSAGYETADGPTKPYELIALAPAGSSAMSGGDMAHFMIAHLQDGKYGDAQILKPETARMMHDTTLDTGLPLNRMALGFYEVWVNGHRAIGHDGDTNYFHTELMLLPADHVGFYISMNSPGKDGAAHVIREALFNAFMDRYFPRVGTPPDRAPDAKTASSHAGMIAGTYDNSRRSITNFVSALNLFGQITVGRNSDGTISVSLLKNAAGDPRRYRETAPFVWSEVGGHDRLAALVRDNRVQRFSSDAISPFMVFLPAATATSSAWLLPADGAAVLVLVLTVLLWPVAILARRHYAAPFRLAGAEALSYRLVRIGSLIDLLAVIAWSAFLIWLIGGAITSGADTDAPLRIVEPLGIAGFMIGPVLALLHVLVVWTRPTRVSARLWSVVILLATLVLLWTAYAFHLLSLSTHY